MKKRIVCFGDSNTWAYDATTGGRFDADIRWTGVLSAELGDEFIIVEEGLSGRTTVFNDPLNKGLSGLNYLYPCMMSHSPIDMLIIMLGTNDTKERFSATAKNIADGAVRLINEAKSAPVWRDSNIEILLVSPVAIEDSYVKTFVAGEMGANCAEKSRELTPLLKNISTTCGCSFLDAGEYVGVNQIDYMHIDLDGHAKLGKAIAEKIKTIL